jgi:hypothetical protein
LLNPVKIPKIPFIFLGKKKICKDLGVCWWSDLSEFAKIRMPESLKIFTFFLKESTGVFWKF